MERPLPSGPKDQPDPRSRPSRIETQIHRRKKARALSPLTAEWDARRPESPPQLRMPANRMKKSR
jgi:hypothetical protein